MTNTVKSLLVLTSMFFFGATYAQGWGSSGWGGDGGSDSDTDSTSTEGGDDSGWGGGWGSESSSANTEEYKFKMADYKRFTPPYDTNREIIFYQGVIEDYDCVECGADSLYYRAKQYMVKFFGKDAVKKYVVIDKKSEKIELLVRKPMLTQYGKNNPVEDGIMEYKLVIQFRDGRYKYQVSNFVHENVMPGNQNRVTRTYHEYYMNAKKGVMTTDLYLLTADKEVINFVKGLKKALKEPYNPIEAGEDDW